MPTKESRGLTNIIAWQKRQQSETLASNMMPVHIPAAPLLIQPSTNAQGKAKDGQTIWVPVTHAGNTIVTPGSWLCVSMPGLLLPSLCPFPPSPIQKEKGQKKGKEGGKDGGREGEATGSS